MVSLVGVISITRRYWKCRCGEPGSYAADEVIGIDSRFSRRVQKRVCRLAADLSFAKTSEHLSEWLVDICPETVRTLVEGHGKAMAKFQLDDPTTDAAFAKAKGEVEFAIDAGKVNTREEGWKDLKIGVISKRESCEAVSCAGWEGQRLHAATFVIAFAMIASSKVFRRTWKSRFRRLGVTAFGALHVLGDGASWIWKSATRVLTGCVQTLDIYHASERIAKCVKAIYGEETPEATTAFERGRSLLIAKGWSGVCEWVAELLSLADEAERERRRKATDGVLGYFSKHVGRLNYAERLASGRAIGSGAVEGQAKTLGLRLKSRGARWNSKNVRSMASLVCVRHSPQWEAYWSQAA
jgi:hypothetical protein